MPTSAMEIDLSGFDPCEVKNIGFGRVNTWWRSLKPDTDDDDPVGEAVLICIEHYYQDATLGSARQVLYTASLWSYA